MAPAPSTSTSNLFWALVKALGRDLDPRPLLPSDPLVFFFNLVSLISMGFLLYKAFWYLALEILYRARRRDLIMSNLVRGLDQHPAVVCVLGGGGQSGGGTEALAQKNR